ncbi:hypothetical protein N0B31_10240 [Salinirubellus salinus]|uniref:Uncharacterized protein n=1 Tax=Salinirubellus salinus TaxID=1364945 RepID=A0A9E7R6C5_9EURY|nr:hypothetical protein [Salinirubellus salinus]UWM56654.1 hypothetical protein N0B31_10240 [Salinirubellus salinus]
MNHVAKAFLAFILVFSAVSMPMGMAVAQQANQTQAAQLDIRQPHYVSSQVQTTQSQNGTIYEVRGPVQYIEPTNFDSSRVLGVQVEQDGASVRYDPDIGQYVLDSSGQSGTYTIRWTVRQSVGDVNVTSEPNKKWILWATQQSPDTLSDEQIDAVNNWGRQSSNVNNMTDTEARQLAEWQEWALVGESPPWTQNNSTSPVGVVEKPANVQVDGGPQTTTYVGRVRVSGADLAHVPASEYEETTNASQHWETLVVQPLSDYATEQEIVDTWIERGVAWIKFIISPLSALTGTILTLLVTLFFTPGGLAVLAVMAGVPVTLLMVALVRNKELREKLGEADSIEEARSVVRQELARQMLRQEGLTEGPGLTERMAAPVRQNLGDNLFTVTDTLGAAMTPASLKQIMLAPVIQSGDYVMDYVTDDTGDVLTADIQDEATAQDPDPDHTRVRVKDAPSEAYGALNLDDIPRKPMREGVRAHKLPSVPGAEYESLSQMVQDHADETGVDVQHVYDEDISLYADAIADVLEYVASSDYAREDGSANPSRFLLNALYGMLAASSEQFEAQYLSAYKDAMLYASESLKPEDGLGRKMKRVKQDGINTSTQRADWDYADDGGDSE